MFVNTDLQTNDLDWVAPFSDHKTMGSVDKDVTAASWAEITVS